MHPNSTRTWLMLVTILLSPLLALAVQQTTALLIDGRQGQAEVIQVQGKNYVEVDELARITALCRKSDYSDIARERRCIIAGPAVGASATTWFF